ncbi:nudix-type nucleoside diphosphatase (YffH/AdpP family) [Enterobacter sp. BIGb0383]|uniref:NUDIX domain-containing protein n=1 Tax=unclassified Enterobacter TaxID=2608935 RepID=UPI000F4963F0|nr:MULTISPECIES: NUDIX domain-containing protein [unclassified Enterobacter]ROP62132.1 nudix-type nucleoside diphosphatase (YffH/AdpP family) [Enterobacter sp. BIGb0383]ROS12293.1 nudix-type nucleoside diphosphatase (YffH/AdpP family) [Enterobacter sp. BIGb0359]
MQSERAKVRIIGSEVLSDDWYLLKKYTFDFPRRDGEWQRQTREVYDRGNGAAILLYNVARQTLILTRQFRCPLYVNGHDGFLLEVPAGLLDNLAPEERIKAEAEEETGYRIDHVQKVFDAFMSPGSVTEKLSFFIAEYDASQQTGDGGGVKEEGEDIEVVEMAWSDALAAVESGEIADAKTIMLIQYAALKGIMGRE